MSEILTDEEMAKLEAAGKAKTVSLKQEPQTLPDSLSDEDMAKLESQGQVKSLPIKDILKEKPSIAKSFFGSASNAATLGYLPELEAAIEPKAFEMLGGGLAAEQSKGKGFTKRREEYAKELEEAAKENPIASTLGTVSGGVLGALGGGALARAIGGMIGAGGMAAAPATVVGRVAQAAKASATFGGLSNPQQQEGNYDPIQLGERAKNAAIGLGFGVGTQLGAEGVAKAAPAVSDKLSEWAAKRATRALGRPTPTQAAEMARTGMDVKLGRELLDQKAVPVLGTSSRIAKRVDKLADKNWEGVEKLLDIAGDKGVVDGTKVGVALLDDPKLALLRQTPGEEATVAAVERAAETFSKSGNMSLRQAQAIKRQMDEGIKYSRGIPDLQGKQQAQFLGRTALRDSMDEAVTDMGAEQGALKAAFKKQGLLEEARQIAEREAGRNQANRGVSLTDTIAAVGAGASKGPVIGLLAGAANKAGRSVGSSVLARGWDAAAKAVASTAEGADVLASNPEAFQFAVNRLLSAIDGSDKMKPADDPILTDPGMLQLFEQNPQLLQNIKDPMRRKLIERKIGSKPKK